jgi:hypothetical protein
MNRRNLLSAGPALMVLAGAGLNAAAAAPNPDADLLAVCAEFNACDLRQRAIYDGPDAVEDDGRAALAAAPIFARMDALLNRMEHLRAASPAGIAARAGSLAQHSGGWAFSFEGRGTITGRLLDYLMRDAALLGKGGAAPSVHPDAELLTLCAEFHRLHNLSYLPGNNDWETPFEARGVLSDKIENMTAVTQAGHRAKAAVAVTMLDENRCAGEFMGCSDARFALSMLRDWLELPA